MAEEFLDSKELEQLTGTRASTWRYWASIGEGPTSFKLGRRRVWKPGLVRNTSSSSRIDRFQGGVEIEGGERRTERGEELHSLKC
jgi:prophage regulatory protein